MELKDYRSQFDLHLFVPVTEDYQEIKIRFRNLGHSVFHSGSGSEFIEEFCKSPSHLVLVDVALVMGEVEDFMADLLERAPQTNFIFIGSGYGRSKYKSFQEFGLLDFVAREDELTSALEWAVDRALERVVLKIQNQSLAEENQRLTSLRIKNEGGLSEGSNSRSSRESLILDSRLASIAEEFVVDGNLEEPLVSDVLKDPSAGVHEELVANEEDLAQLIGLYENIRVREDLLQVFFHSLENFRNEDTKILFFKYLEPVQLLVATHGSGIPVEDIKGAGVRLTPDEVLEAKTLLPSPRGFGSLNKLLSDVFNVKECFVKPLLVREDVDGLFVFFGPHLDQFNTIHFNNRFALFKVSYERFHFLKKQLELELEGVLEHICPYEEVFESLSDRLEQLKRHQMGIAVLRLSIDRLHFIEEKFGPTAVTSLIRSLAVTIKKYMRSGDSLYRTALNEFSLLAVQLKPQEATVLAERLRLAMENIDIPPITGSISLSVGVSAYPQLATTPEALMKGSLQALTTAMGQGGNRVGVAKALKAPRVARLVDTLEKDL